MAFKFPNSPSVGDLFAAPTGVMYVYDGSWTTSGETQTVNPFLNFFRYRSIYVRGYTSGGYKSSSPWKNTNRTIHATDITVNLGDRLDYGAGYVHGGYSDFNLYVYGVTDTFQAYSVYTSSVNMSTEAARAHSTSWDLKTSRRYQPTVLMNGSLTIAYITGGATNGSTDKHNLVTEIMLALGSCPSRSGTGTHSGGCYGNGKGWFRSSNSSEVLSFPTETWASWGQFTGTEGVNKGHSTKHGHGYLHAGNNQSTNVYTKFSDITGSIINTSMVDNNPAGGEENHQTGQNHGYYLGNYATSLQGNNTSKLGYLTDTCVAMGSDTMPKGHDGMSSGASASASARILGGGRL